VNQQLVEIAKWPQVHSFLRLRFILPSRPRSRSCRAQARSRLAASAATGRLGLDRPEHGGTLVRTGTGLRGRLELNVNCDYDY
jgi:hypothetical protein